MYCVVVVLELIYMVILVYDDVIDKSDKCRGWFIILKKWD